LTNGSCDEIILKALAVGLTAFLLIGNKICGLYYQAGLSATGAPRCQLDVVYLLC